MADTIINTPSPAPSDNSSAGWAVAVIILILVIGGGFVWYRTHRAAAPAADTTNIQVTVPSTNSTNPAQ